MWLAKDSDSVVYAFRDKPDKSFNSLSGWFNSEIGRTAFRLRPGKFKLPSWFITREVVFVRFLKDEWIERTIITGF